MAGGGINADNISFFENMTETNIFTTWPPVSNSSTNLTDLESSQMDSDPYVDLMTDVSKYLWIVLSPILFVVGVTGNLLTIGVLKRIKFHKKPPYFFLFVLALSDIMVLCVGLSRYWIRETFLVDVRTLSNFGCKVNLFCIYWSMQVSSWILVCVVLERCIKTNFPLRYPRLVTMPRCIMLVLFLTVFLSGVDLHYFWTNGLISEDSEIDCTSLTVGYFNFEEFIFTYVDFCVLSAIPFLLMIGMNMFIIRVIRRSREFRKSTVRNKSTNKKLKKFDVKLTRMLVSTSVYFLLATLPISIYFIVDSYQTDLDNRDSAKMDVVWTVSYLVQFSNYTINFFLYNLTNKRFRAKFIEMIKCKSAVKKRKSSKNESVYSVHTAETSLGTETSFGTETSRVSEEMSSGE